ncbi:MAG: redoxin domain-containing protein, partial [Spirochaetaceae bacterium]|nr:redoxin domain-containing protein [Spirochaetaceae bacterium]
MLQVGDMVPEFSLPNQDGTMISPAEFKGKKMVIYFYPKDNT